MLETLFIEQANKWVCQHTTGDKPPGIVSSVDYKHNDHKHYYWVPVHLRNVVVDPGFVGIPLNQFFRE